MVIGQLGLVASLVVSASSFRVFGEDASGVWDATLSRTDPMVTTMGGFKAWSESIPGSSAGFLIDLLVAPSTPSAILVPQAVGVDSSVQLSSPILGSP